MKFCNPYTLPLEAIESIQNWLLVHSIIYYELDSNLVSDRVYDGNCKQLVKLKNKYPDEFKESKLNYVYYDFDGTTGFDLRGRLTKKDRKIFVKRAKKALFMSKYFWR